MAHISTPSDPGAPPRVPDRNAKSPDKCGRRGQVAVLVTTTCPVAPSRAWLFKARLSEQPQSLGLGLILDCPFLNS